MLKWIMQPAPKLLHSNCISLGVPRGYEAKHNKNKEQKFKNINESDAIQRCAASNKISHQTSPKFWAWQEGHGMADTLLSSSYQLLLSEKDELIFYLTPIMNAQTRNTYTGLLHYNGGMWSGQKVRYSEKSVIENNRTKYNGVVLLCAVRQKFHNIHDIQWY